MKVWKIASAIKNPGLDALSPGFASATVLALAILVFPQIVTATTSVTTNANAGGTHMIHPNNGLADNDSVTGANGQPSQAISAMSNSGTVYSGAAPYPPVGTQNAQATAYAYSIEGLLRASVSAGANTAGIVYNSASANSAANARWDDYLTVDAGDALRNQLGFITAEMNVSGNFGGSPGDYGQMSLGVRLSGTGMAGDYTNCGGWAYCISQRASNGAYFAGPQIDINTLPSTVSLVIPVYFGRAVTLGYALDLYATGDALTFANGNPTGAASFADFSNTLRWGGITGVFDANGNAIGGFTTASTSGFDYLHPAPVPVPAAAWLFGSGLIGLFGIAKRKSRV